MARKVRPFVLLLPKAVVRLPIISGHTCEPLAAALCGVAAVAAQAQSDGVVGAGEVAHREQQLEVSKVVCDSRAKHLQEVAEGAKMVGGRTSAITTCSHDKQNITEKGRATHAQAVDLLAAHSHAAIGIARLRVHPLVDAVHRHLAGEHRRQRAVAALLRLHVCAVMVEPVST